MATLFFSFGGLFQITILLVNSIAVLSEDRFLARIGWGTYQEQGFGQSASNDGFRAKTINLIHSIRTLMRIPLIFLNLMVIIWSVAFG
ncbi:Yos1-like protein [Piedraia hortae CBS 480.64]|uniref:Yos1-like protein n=1 Tax=Piedraia hortae CBS 480.64 TaxID=1314780 RepID=A0A6A7BS12_9PEZI|nr:Yos1-like protein [Piedraia hortae CBS 480.64]